MISFRQIRSFFLMMVFTVMLAVTIAFDFGTAESWAATSLIQPVSPSQTQIAMWGRAKATAKNIEGKTQEAIGNITGDPKDQIMGKAKQVESQARNAAEDVKDAAGDVKDKMRSKAEAGVKKTKEMAKTMENKAKKLSAK